MAQKGIIWGMVIALFLLGALVSKEMNWFGMGATTGGDGTSGGAGQITVETLPEDVTVTFNDYDLQDKINDPASVLRMYSPDVGNISDDGTTTMSPKELFKAIAGFHSTTYYGQALEDNAGTADQKRFDVGLARASTLTVTVTNDDGKTVNSNANNQTIDANDERDLEICYDAVTNQYWGSPDAEGKSQLIFFYNKTYIKTVNIDTTGNPGYALSLAPSTYSTGAGIHDGGLITYNVPNLADGEKKCFTARIKSTGSDPTGDAIQGVFLDANTDLNLDDFSIIRGTEDEDQTNLTLKPIVFSIYYK